MLFDAQSGLVLAGFEDHAVRYNEEKVPGKPYALVSGRFGEDIYTAPEVWEEEMYNARKAVVWSCGVVLVSSRFLLSNISLLLLTWRHYSRYCPQKLTPNTTNNITVLHGNRPNRSPRRPLPPIHPA